MAEELLPKRSPRSPVVEVLAVTFIGTSVTGVTPVLALCWMPPMGPLKGFGMEKIVNITGCSFYPLIPMCRKYSQRLFQPTID